MEYSLFRLDIEFSSSDILRTCRELGVAIVAFSPIGRGTCRTSSNLTRTFLRGDLRCMLPKYSEGSFSQSLKLVQRLQEVANFHGSTPVQVALAWLLAQGPDIIFITVTKLTARMDENAASELLQLNE